MRVLCPHCRIRVELPELDTDEDLTCPACDSRIDLSGADTVTVPYLPQELIGNFELIEQLGRGGCGTVYRVFDRELKREVALKIPHETGGPSDNAQTLKEARAAAVLDHANIVPVYEIGRANNRVYIVSQLVPGLSLSDLISSRELTATEAATMCEQIAHGLQHAHDRGVIHRDIKPSNILLDSDNQPKITDFGLAKRIDQNQTATADGPVMGTFAYMPPEQARGENTKVDGRSDIYSLGVILYQLLTNKRPFTGTARAILKQVIGDEPVKVRAHNPKVPRDLETICLKAMDKVPERRYQSSSELADDLRRYLEGTPIRARHAGLTERAYRWLGRNKPTATIAILLIMLVAVTFAFVLSPGDDSAGKWICHLDTDPPGAELTLVRLIPELRQPVSEAPIIVTSPARVALQPGEYEVSAVHDSGKRHIVLRTVPALEQTLPHGLLPHLYFTESNAEPGTLELPDVKLFDHDEVTTSSDMAFVKGGTFSMGVPGEKHENVVSDFYMQRSLVTVKQFKDRVLESPYVNDVLLVMPDLEERRDAEPLTSVTYDAATLYAELTGTRLPSERQYEFAATNGGTSKFPHGETESTTHTWSATEVDPNDINRWGIRGLLSGPGEWTRSSPIDLEAQFPEAYKQDAIGLEPQVAAAIASQRAIRGISTDLLNSDSEDSQLTLAEDTPATLRYGAETRKFPWSHTHVGFRVVFEVK